MEGSCLLVLRVHISRHAAISRRRLRSSRARSARNSKRRNILMVRLPDVASIDVAALDARQRRSQFDRQLSLCCKVGSASPAIKENATPRAVSLAPMGSRASLTTARSQVWTRIAHARPARAATLPRPLSSGTRRLSSRRSERGNFFSLAAAQLSAFMAACSLSYGRREKRVYPVALWMKRAPQVGPVGGRVTTNAFLCNAVTDRDCLVVRIDLTGRSEIFGPT
jgi:hypothetical protein